MLQTLLSTNFQFRPVSHSLVWAPELQTSGTLMPQYTIIFSTTAVIPKLSQQLEEVFLLFQHDIGPLRTKLSMLFPV